MLAFIDQLHYMATIPDLPYSTLKWGGTNSGVRLTNTCPLDGPLTWFLTAIGLFPRLENLVQMTKFSDFMKIFELFREGRSSAAKKFWLENVAEKSVDNGDSFGSETEQFFEPLSKTELAKLSYSVSCGTCPVKTKQRSTLTLNSKIPKFNERVEAADEVRAEKCLKCK